MEFIFRSGKWYVAFYITSGNDPPQPEGSFSEDESGVTPTDIRIIYEFNLRPGGVAGRTPVGDAGTGSRAAHQAEVRNGENAGRRSTLRDASPQKDNGAPDEHP